MLNFQKLELIYSNLSAVVNVWKCKENDTGELFALKEQGFASKEKADTALREYRIQKSLEHLNICKVLSYCQDTRQDKTFNLLALEWMDKQDLYKEITNRAKNSFPWEENALWQHFRELVDALSFAQSRGIAHRDIKPQNIFINNRNELKIGDFGSAKELDNSKTSTLVGTPYYLSPALRSAFLNGSSLLKVEHNPYKSDVYSLGITFLFMCVLQAPVAIGADVSEDFVRNIVQGVRYSDTMKQLLSWMLIFEESNRPDFLQINAWLNPGITHLPSQEASALREGTPMKCKTCFLEFTLASAPWRALLEGDDNFCSLDCYHIMSSARETQKSDVQLCMFCRKWTPDPWDLSCGQHFVCSMECGRALILNTSRLLREFPICPECNVYLDQEQVNELFEGRLENMKETHSQCICDNCRSNLGDRFYSACRHHICTVCFTENVSKSSFFYCPLRCDSRYISNQSSA